MRRLKPEFQGPQLPKTTRLKGAKQATITEDRIVQIERSALMPSPLNPRTHYSESSIAGLADNIREVGIIEPLIVRPAADVDAARGFTHEVIAGHRRLRAAEVAGLAFLPAQVRSIGDSAVLDLMLSENLQREDLNPIEEAQGLQQWLALPREDGGPRTKKDASERLGKTERHIDNCLRLLRLPKKAKEALEAETIGSAIGYLIAKVPSEDLRKRLTSEVLSGFGEGPMSKREVIDHIRRNYMVELRGSAFSQSDATLVPIVEKDGERVAGGACKDCPWNTANMPDSADGKMHLCTNPACYQAKMTHHVEAVKSAAVKAGKLVIEGEQARRYIYHDGTPGYQTGMVSLDEAPSAAEVVGERKPPKWRKLLAGKASGEIVSGRTEEGEAIKGKVEGEIKVPTTVVFDSKGRAHELVDRKLAIEVARKNGYTDLFSPRASRAKSGAQAEQQEREAAERAKQKLESATASAALGELVAEIGKRGISEAAWWGILELAYFHAGSDGEAFLCQRRGLEVKKSELGHPEKEKAIRAHAETLLPASLPGLAIELLLAGWMKHRGVEAPGFAAMAKVFELDVKAIKARVKAEVAEKKKPKPKKAKKEPPPKPVRELIGELAPKHGLKTLAAIDDLAMKTCGRPYDVLQGGELTALLDAIKELPVPEKKAKAKKGRGK